MDYRSILNYLPEAKRLVRQGYNYTKFMSVFGVDELYAKLIYSVALANIRYSDKFSRDILIDVDSARLATHEIVSDYHARRLKSKLIADLGCGVGVQLAFFARYSDHAIGVELDSRRVEFAKINSELYGVSEKVDVISGNVFDESVIRQLKDADIIFSDPARPYNEPVRKLESCSPNPKKIVESYAHITDNFSFDLPPQIRRDRVNLFSEQEFEYISVNGLMNRLTLYSGDLVRSERSAIVLPYGDRLEFDPNIPRDLSFANLKSIIYDVDAAVVAAGLIPELVHTFDLSLFHKDRRRFILTSDELKQSHLFRGIYLVDGSYTRTELTSRLSNNGFGKVILRYPLPPNDYYRERKNFENSLSGDKVAYIFRHNGKYVLTTRYEY